MGKSYVKPKAWERKRGETSRAHQAFIDYLNLGPGRSLSKLAALYVERAAQGVWVPCRYPKTVEKWSAKYHWQERLAEWERWQLDEEELAWAIRRRQIREREWEQGDKLWEIVKEALKTADQFVKTTKRVVKKGKPAVVDMAGNLVEDGEPEQVLVNQALDLQSVLKAFEVASKLTRLGVGSPTDVTETRVNSDIMIGLLRRAEEELALIVGEEGRDG